MKIAGILNSDNYMEFSLRVFDRLKVVESQEGHDGSHLPLQPRLGDDVSRLGFLDS